MQTCITSLCVLLVAILHAPLRRQDLLYTTVSLPLAGVQDARSAVQQLAAVWMLVSTLTTSTAPSRQAAPSILTNIS